MSAQSRAAAITDAELDALRLDLATSIPKDGGVCKLTAPLVREALAVVMAEIERRDVERHAMRSGVVAIAQCTCEGAASAAVAVHEHRALLLCRECKGLRSAVATLAEDVG